MILSRNGNKNQVTLTTEDLILEQGIYTYTYSHTHTQTRHNCSYKSSKTSKAHTTDIDNVKRKCLSLNFKGEIDL